MRIALQKLVLPVLLFSLACIAQAAPRRAPVFEMRLIPQRYAKGHERAPILDRKLDVALFRDSVTKEDVDLATVLAKSRVIAQAKDLKPNSTVLTGARDAIYVTFELKEAAARKFADITAKHVGSYVAMLVEGEMISCPLIMSRVPGKGVIESRAFTGPNGRGKAEELARKLNQAASHLPKAKPA